MTTTTKLTKRQMFEEMTTHISSAEFFYGWKINGKTRERWERVYEIYQKHVKEIEAGGTPMNTRFNNRNVPEKEKQMVRLQYWIIGDAL